MDEGESERIRGSGRNSTRREAVLLNFVIVGKMGQRITLTGEHRNLWKMVCSWFTG